MKQSSPSSHLTHATGTPVTDNLNIQTAGPRGPALLQDVQVMSDAQAKAFPFNPFDLTKVWPKADGGWLLRTQP
jgi:catalase